MRFQILSVLLLTSAASFAATWHREINLKLFAKLHPVPPRSIVMLALQHVQSDLLELQCSLSPLRVIPISRKKAQGSADSSRTFKLENSSKGVLMSECLKGLSCFQLNQLPIKNALRFEGSTYTYSIEGQTSELNGVLSRQRNCTTGHLNLLENNNGQLKIPSSLWVLNYGAKIVLWDPIQEKSWFRVKLPNNFSIDHIKSVRVSREFRMIVEGSAGSVLLLDWLNDFSIFRSSNGSVWNTEAGVGSAAHSEEWIQTNKNQNLSMLSSQDLKIAGTAGVTVASHFIAWEQLNPSIASGRPTHTFSGRIIASSENQSLKNPPSLTLAVLDEGEIGLFEWRRGHSSIEQMSDSLRHDLRAKDTHYLIGGPSLFRLTADGFYSVKNETEIPTALRGLKANVFELSGVFRSLEKTEQGCSMSLWMLPQYGKKYFSPLIANKPCYKSPSVGIFPGGSSLSGWNGQKYFSDISVSE